MRPRPSGTPVEELVRMIREATGNTLSPARVGVLEDAAGRRARALGLADLGLYVSALALGELPEEWGFLAAQVTIKESFFYRAPQQLEALRREVLPALLQARAGERRLRFWSAACARGEEPATLALLLAEEPSLAGWDWTIVATDLDAEALAGARAGLYGERAVAQVPPEVLARWFTPRGKRFELAPELRERITYLPLNLARPPYKLPAAPFDLILLRNVLLYFRRSLQRKVVAETEGLLAPDGTLFLGATETLWPGQGRLVPVEVGGCFVYRFEAGPSQAAAPPPPPTSPLATAAPRRDRPRSDPPPEPPLEPPSSEPRPGSLQEAVLLLAEDCLDEAATLLEAILSRTPSDPEAHAVHGFLLDIRGEEAGAVAAYRGALYLDPELFQVRLLLAEGHLRRREAEAAERQFREVLTLLTNGRGRPLAAFAPLPVPDRERAERRSRQVLAGTS